MSSKYIFTAIILLFTSCSFFEEEKVLPNEKTYAEDTTLMLNICSKFIEETDIPKMHKAAKATQTIRVIKCNDYNNECNLYSEFLNTLVQLSADGSMDETDRVDLRKQLDQLRAAIETGKMKLHQEWINKANAHN